MCPCTGPRIAEIYVNSPDSFPGRKNILQTFNVIGTKRYVVRFFITIGSGNIPAPHSQNVTADIYADPVYFPVLTGRFSQENTFSAAQIQIDRPFISETRHPISPVRLWFSYEIGTSTQFWSGPRFFPNSHIKTLLKRRPVKDSVTFFKTCDFLSFLFPFLIPLSRQDWYRFFQCITKSRIVEVFFETAQSSPQFSHNLLFIRSVQLFFLGHSLNPEAIRSKIVS